MTIQDNGKRLRFRAQDVMGFDFARIRRGDVRQRLLCLAGAGEDIRSLCEEDIDRELMRAAWVALLRNRFLRRRREAERQAAPGEERLWMS